MIQSPEIEHRPIRVLFDYFERAVEDLGLKAWSTLLKPGNEVRFQRRIVYKVYSGLPLSRSQYSGQWTEESLSEQERVLLHLRREETLSDPERYLRWEPWEDPEEEIRAHYMLQAAILATLTGDSDHLRTLAAQLITEPMNRKLAIAYFLGNLTDGKVGLTYKELPTKAQILQWLEEIKSIQLDSRLAEIAELQFERG